MANYPLAKMNKEGTLLHPQHSYCLMNMQRTHLIYSCQIASLKTSMENCTSIIVSMQNRLTILKWLLPMIFIAQIVKAVC
jgi:hypothetical protein